MKRLSRNDDGAVLILALLIITVMSVVISALLTEGNGSLLASVQLRNVSSRAFAADAAAQVAITDLEQGYGIDSATAASNVQPIAPSTTWTFQNSGFDGCFGNTSSGAASNTIQLGSVGTTANPYSAAVDCSAVSGTGINGTALGTGVNNIPGGNNGKADALVTVGSASATDGITLKPLNSTQFRVRGSVLSNSTIDAGNGLVASGYVKAHGACSGTILALAAPAACNGPAVPVPSGYTTNVTSVPALATPPTSCTNGVAVFQPGYYDDATLLNNVASLNCSYQWFQPGNYYFDFHNNSQDVTANNNAVPSASDTWNMNGTIVGGAIAPGWNGSTLPGACVSPIDSKTASGVQFVFGGDSRVSLADTAHVELCATSVSSGRPIVMYGLTSGTAALSSPATPYTANTTTSDQATALAVTPGALGAVGGGAATWTNPSLSSSATWTVTTSNFDPAATVPPGSMIKTATLKITHQEPTGGNAPTVKVNGTTVAGATKSIGSYATDSLNVLAAISKPAHDGGLSNVSIAIADSVPKLATESIDAVQLVLTYYPPALRGLGTSDISSNCYPGCNFWLTGNGSSYKGSFFLQGATFVPTGAFNFGLGNQSLGDAFRYGVVAWGLNVTMLNKYPSGVPVVSIPDNTPGYGSNVTVVDLTVYVCSGSSPCPASGASALTARVKITDPSDTEAEPGTRQISILSWAEQR